MDDLRARLRVAHEDLAAAHERERAHGAGLEHFRDRQAAITAELGRVSELDADLRAARAELADARDAERDARDAEARAVAAEKRAAASETAALARVRELEYAGGDRVVFSDSPGAQIVAKIRADAAERAVDDLVAARGLAPAAMGTPENGDGSSPESNPSSSLVRAAVAEAEARTRDRFAARVETLENQLKDARDQRDREALLRSNPSRADQSSLAGAVLSEDAPESSSPESLIALRRRAEDAESALASSAFELALATTARDALEGELESTREDLAAAREEVAALRRRLATRPSAEAATAAQQQRTPGGGDGRARRADGDPRAAKPLAVGTRVEHRVALARRVRRTRAGGRTVPASDRRRRGRRGVGGTVAAVGFPPAASARGAAAALGAALGRGAGDARGGGGRRSAAGS